MVGEELAECQVKWNDNDAVSGSFGIVRGVKQGSILFLFTILEDIGGFKVRLVGKWVLRWRHYRTLSSSSGTICSG